MIKTLKSQFFTILLGISFGLIFTLIFPVFYEYILEEYDERYPVVAMKGALIERKDNYAIVEIAGEKLRDENCIATKIFAFLETSEGVKHDVLIESADPIHAKPSRKQGFYNVGKWKISPIIPEADKLHVYIQHRCLDRDIITEIANVKLR